MGAGTPPPLSKTEDDPNISNSSSEKGDDCPFMACTGGWRPESIPSCDSRVYPVGIFRSWTRFFRTRRRSWVEKGPP
ncbi:hypothetical protein V6N13_082528 [Hibiscus sabdariffa]|uniref:Uncharacterized protein n=1 Tax=Hibiscus sabdariffa TaxID=183260 RepID=A0ABR2Q3N7_9ROSI